MKIKVSNYIAQFLVDHGVHDAFTVVGGGAMHLNDAFGHQKGLHCIYNHHEQACAIAAEAYARIHNELALLCVTTGPGGTNAITGVVGGWLDSIPMLVISGQVRYDTTARSTGLPLRAMGDQEFDITKAIDCMTKYSEMVIDPLKIKYCLEKALYLSTHGRPGPCWLDIPLNVQGAYIETDDLYAGYIPEAVDFSVDDETIKTIIEKIRSAKRPVINAGNGIRISGGWKEFRELITKLNIPVVTGWDSIDLIEDKNPLYVGRGGIMGDRAGNFAIQNSDLILSLGSRLSIRQVGYNYETWAREAYVIMVDIDRAELQKPTLHVEMPVEADVKLFMKKMNAFLTDEPLYNDKFWLSKCDEWKNKYPVVQPKHYLADGLTNVYAFIKKLSDYLPENYTTVVGNGSACVVGSQGYVIKNGTRFIVNSAIASMGYDLPAAIGACVAQGNKELVLVTGDGSLQMNIQELQTVITNKFPIKIFVINNSGYHSIRQTQNKFFEKPYVGIGPDSNDLTFPDLEKIAWAYGYDFCRCNSNKEIDSCLDKAFKNEGAYICEIMVDKEQVFEPKSSAKRLDDGTLVSPPIEELSPFLSDDEMDEIMLIPRIKP